jgi:hypothetical protein
VLFEAIQTISGLPTPELTYEGHVLHQIGSGQHGIDWLCLVMERREVDELCPVALMVYGHETPWTELASMGYVQSRAWQEYGSST